MKLDIRDKKLLQELWMDCRQPNTQLASKLKTSREVIQYRIRRLENAGIIYGYITLINPDKFGYSTYTLHLRFREITDEREKEIIDFLKELALVKWVALVSGRWDVMVTLLAKSSNEIDMMISKITEFIGDNMRDMQVMQHVRLLKDASLPIFLKNKQSALKKKSAGLRRTDKLDKIILSSIAEDSRATLVDLSKALGESPQTISYRMKRLKNAGIIRGYRAKVDLSQFGYLWYLVMFELGRFTAKEEALLTSLLESMPEVIYAEKLIGRWNLKVEVAALDHESLRKSLNKIRNSISQVMKAYDLEVIFKDYAQVSLPKGLELSMVK